ncbi:MAG: deoxyribodipyrimidine photo-lyase [Burkholderiales bacterium]|nr:deoxyribodipyrimidine photo-lyase [Burkholderiales bacterium]
MSSPVIVWLRNDLRLADNPAVAEAARLGVPFVGLYVLDEDSEGLRPMGGASRWWLHHALAALAADVADLGGILLLTRGPARAVMARTVAALAPAAVLWNRRYDAAGIAVDTAIKADIRASGIRADSFNASLLYEPWQVKSRTGEPLKVFSPFWRAAQALGEPPAPLPTPARFAGGAKDLAVSDAMTLDALDLLPRRPDWAGGLRDTWRPGERGARERLAKFLEDGLAHYADGRDRPDRDYTSRLSPWLRFGEIGPRQVWHAASAARLSGASQASARDLDKFRAELGWREFSYHLLHQRPDMASVNIQRKFDAFPWRNDDAALRAWRRGATGYPIVDAGMRQLWTTGWMHNRVRMIAASFLIKHLLVDWRRGEDWFWDTLVDADPASNAASWQWVAGSGADAAPYFRIFNPILQGEKFDPSGDYVRTFVPELRGVPADIIHQPWSASQQRLSAAGVVLGQTYPRPIVDHDDARKRALEALSAVKPNDI